MFSYRDGSTRDVLDTLFRGLYTFAPYGFQLHPLVPSRRSHSKAWNVSADSVGSLDSTLIPGLHHSAGDESLPAVLVPVASATIEPLVEREPPGGILRVKGCKRDLSAGVARVSGMTSSIAGGLRSRDSRLARTVVTRTPVAL